MSELLHFRGEAARRLVDTVRDLLIRRDSRHPHCQKARLVAIGRSVDGGAFVVTAPTDWPTSAEIDDICERHSPVAMTVEQYLEERAEERRSE